MKYSFGLIVCLLLCSCTKGPHVSSRSVYISKYACEYSESIWTQDRTIALCDTVEECNKICEGLRK